MNRLLASILAFGAFGVPALASADTTVLVLGIRSVEGDDDVARNLTGALRNSASRIAEWGLAEAEVSLAQMSMVHGCDEPDAACMVEIANELGPQRIIYGTVRRTSAGDEYNFALTLYFFNAESGQIEDSLTDNIPRAQSDIDDLRARSTRYVAQFSGQARYGMVRLTVNRPNASVRIDGEAMGVTDDNGVLVIEDVAEGQRSIEISAMDYDSFEGTVRIVADEQSEFRANLIAETSANLGWIPGVALIGVGAISFAVGMSQWIPNLSDRGTYNDLQSLCNSDAGCPEAVQNAMQIQSGSLDPSRRELFEAMAVVAGNGGNLCSETTTSNMGSSAGRAEGICDEQDRRKILAIVFNIIALAAVGTGAALLFSSLGSSDDGEASLQLSPMVGRRHGGLMAHIQF